MSTVFTFTCRYCSTIHHRRGAQYANFYCNNKCQRNYEREIRIKKWLNGELDWKLQVPVWAKYEIRRSQGNHCNICKIIEWNNMPITLECDHIDGNPHNNVRSNLQLICPNCHSQTSSFKGKNRGNGRTTRYNKE
jgi:protein-arginine kinase activator protein McsA